MNLRGFLVAFVMFSCLVPSSTPGRQGGGDGASPEIDWQPWSAEVFRQAEIAVKPVLVNVRAHWHRHSIWMDEKVYSDPEVRRLIREIWLPVEVDRDRRPDINLRYQLAVKAVNPRGPGWPLTLFLFDTGELIYGDSLLYVEDRPNKPGMITFLRKGLSYAETRNADVSTRHLTARIFEEEKKTVNHSGMTWTTLEKIGRSMIEALDPSWGGFEGDRRLYPYATELAGNLYHRTGDELLLDVMTRTLAGMEIGAIHDRVGGGFHRSARDHAWRIPSFEKPLNYNAPLLVDYLLGYEATGDPEFRQVAEGIVRFLLTDLQSPAGGFYVGQWAVGSSDDPVGGYYTWQRSEFEKVIPKKHLELARNLFEITEEGELRLGPPPRNTLHLATSREAAAEDLGMTVDEVRKGEQEILEALRAARAKRIPPPIEKAVYVDSCAAAVIALLEAHRVLGLDEAREAALRALERLLEAVPQGNPLLHRVEPAPEPGYDPALALDHMMLARAAIAAYEATGRDHYLSSARNLVDRAVALFWDPGDVGFFDVVEDKDAIGYLSIRRYLSQDTAFPALNALAARVLERLYLHTGETVHRERAAKCLQGLIGVSRRLRYHDGSLGLALERYLNPPTRYYVVGPKDTSTADRLETVARSVFDPGKLVVRLVPGYDDPEIARLGTAIDEGAYALVCRSENCSEPILEEEDLRQHAMSLLGTLRSR